MEKDQRQIPTVVIESLLKIATEIDWNRAILNDPTSSPEVIVRKILESGVQQHKFNLSNYQMYSLKEIIAAKKARGLKGFSREVVQKHITKNKYKPYGKDGREPLYKGEDVRVYVIGGGKEGSRDLLSLHDYIQDKDQLKKRKEQYGPQLQKLQLQQKWKQLLGMAELSGPESLARIKSKLEHDVLDSNVRDSLVRRTINLVWEVDREIDVPTDWREELIKRASERSMKWLEQQAAELVKDVKKSHSKGHISSQKTA